MKHRTIKEKEEKKHPKERLSAIKSISKPPSVAALLLNFSNGQRFRDPRRNLLNETDVPALEELLLELFNTFQVFLLTSFVSPNFLISLGYPALLRPFAGA